MMRNINTITTSLLLAVFGLLSGCQKKELNDILKPEATSSMKQQGASATSGSSLTCYSTTSTTSKNGQSVTYSVYSCYYSDGGKFISPDYPTNFGDVEREQTSSGGYAVAAYEHINSDLQLTPGPPPTDPQNYNCAQQRSAPSAIRRVDVFVMDNYGNTRTACIGQRGFYDLWYDGTVELPKGPSVRYVRDPLNPNIVIDLQRMLVMGNWGLYVSTSNEIAAYLTTGDGYFGYNDRDYFSFQLGADFYANYASQIATNPTNFAQLVSDFLNDPAQRTAYTDGSKCR